ncbi:CoA ester lyase [Hyphobacterium sp. HN65]|uniref:CoA ester lyase n=1 Tax=Hyphobacterium lacteum TaxID=3116575 RepID=A0ABU7LTS3_9PROT|nr:CoA ester lyase [Hyphobacterium sp. HN65]MEE2527301.1 CoA ester lyase [Hyphobacterium sp. HN65]
MTSPSPIRPIRSALFVPGSRPRAIEKAAGLGADMLILDLEDAAGPDEKADARGRVSDALAQWAGCGAVRAIRVNAIGTGLEADDIAAAMGADAIVMPKVEGVADIEAARALMPDGPPLWAMIETPLALFHLREIGEAAGALNLSGVIAGTNDLSKELKAMGRGAMTPHLAQIVAAGRAYGLTPLDGVFNAYQDAHGFAAEASEGRALGFAGKSLIHPSQVQAANKAFGPLNDEIDAARRLVAAFALPENAGKGAIPFEGRMAERLHLAEAEALLKLSED